MFKKKVKKLIFDLKIALRTEGSNTAQNPNFCAYFLNACLQCSKFPATVERLKQFIGGPGESVD
jgi:hypothetical protein